MTQTFRRQCRNSRTEEKIMYGFVVSSSVCTFSSTKPMEVVGYAHSSNGNSVRTTRYPFSLFKFRPTSSPASFISLKKQGPIKSLQGEFLHVFTCRLFMTAHFLFKFSAFLVVFVLCSYSASQLVAIFSLLYCFFLFLFEFFVFPIVAKDFNL